MRIISGKHRGRRIEMKEGKDIRPTSSKARQAIFNILSHGEFSGPDASPFIERKVADLFCGSGALGLEALSRGAGSVTFVDQSQDSLNLVRASAEKFGESKNIRLLRSDSSKLGPSITRHSLVFLDPPYNKNLAVPALESLVRSNWLEPNAVCVVELSAKEAFILPPHYEIISERHYGAAQILILRFI